MKILSKYELIKIILSKKIDKSDFPLLNDDIRSLLGNVYLDIPQFQNIEIHKICEEMKNASFDIIMTKHNYTFPVQPLILNKLANHQDNFSTSINSISLYTFYTWITINMLLLKGETINCLQTFLSILLRIAEKSYHSSKEDEIRLLAISCFIDLIKTIFLDDRISCDFAEIFQFIKFLFTSNSILPDGTSAIFSIIAHKVINQNTPMNEIAREFLNTVLSITTKDNKIIDREVICEILEIICNYIVNLDSLCLNFFLSVSDIVPIQFISDIFEPILIQMFALQTDTFLGPFENDNTKCSEFCVIQQTIRNYFHPPNNPNQLLDLPDISGVIPEFLTYDKMLNQELYQKIMILIPIIMKREENVALFIICVSKILTKTIEKSHTKIFDYMAIVFCFIESIISVFKITLPYQFIYNDVLFNPNTTIFCQCKNFRQLNTLRQTALSIIIQDQASILKKALSNSSFYPELFIECIYRLQILKNNISQNTRPLAEILMLIMIEYRRYDHIMICAQARKVILVYFSDFLLHQNLKNVFTLPFFIKTFLTLLFENPIRLQLLQILSHILSNLTFAEGLVINKYLNKLIDVACHELVSVDAISLLSDLIKALNEASLFNSNVSSFVREIAPNLCHNILKITCDDDDKSENILMELITFLAATSHECTLKADELSLIESAILHLSNTRPKNQIMDKLVQVIAGKQMSVLLPNFEIQQSKILCSFIRIFINSNYIYKALNIIYELCLFSSSNCIKCHEGELDILIIDYIRKWKIEEKFEINIDTKKVDHFLNLFVKIASVVSSVSVVQRFFSLLCPIDLNLLSSIHESILLALNNILLASKSIPSATLPMTPLCSLQIHGINSTSFEDGFSFVFWVYLTTNSNQFKQCIFKLDDGRYHVFRLIFIGGNLKLKIQNGTDFYHGYFELNAPLKTWIMITMTLDQSKNSHEATARIYLNNIFKKSISKFSTFLPTTNLISCTVNESLKHLSDLKIFPLLGLFMLSKQLNVNEIIQLYFEGPRQICASRYGAIFAYIPHDISQYTTFVSLLKSNSISENHEPILSRKWNVSFFDILLNFCKVSLVIPIFQQIATPNIYGEEFKYLAETGVEILHNIFSLSELAQKSFYKDKGFRIISYLLQNTNSRIYINYNLYSRFFTMIYSITYIKLRQQLLDSIVLNIEIWSLSDSKNLNRIIKHWGRMVYPSCKIMIYELRSFSWFLIIVHSYFGDSNVKYSPENRSIIIEIVNDIYKNGITQTDIFLLIGYISAYANNPDILEKIDFIKLLTSIISNKSIIEELQINISHILIYLHPLFEIDDDNLIFCLIDCIIMVYRLNYEISQSLNDYLDFILDKIQNHVFNDHVFNKLLKNWKENTPELFNVVCYSAILKGEIYILDIISQKPKYCIITDESYMLWPTFMTFFVSKKHVDKVLLFLIDVFSNCWDKVFYSINLIGRATKRFKKMDVIKHSILILMSQHISTTENLIQLLNIIKHFIIYRYKNCESSVSKQITSYCNQYYSNMYLCKASTKPKKRHICYHHNIYRFLVNSITEYGNENNFDTIGLRFTNDNSWMDADLALISIKLFNNYNITQFFDIMLVYYHFLEKNNQKIEGQEEVLILFRKYIKQNSISKVDYSKYHQFFSLIESFFINKVDDLHHDIIAFEKKISNKIIRFLSALPLIFPNESNYKYIEQNLNNLISHFLEKQGYTLKQNMKEWSHLWRSLTVDRAPWADSLLIYDEISEGDSENKIFERLNKISKRDNSFCSNFCPLKIRRSFNSIFQNHLNLFNNSQMNTLRQFYEEKCKLSFYKQEKINQTISLTIHSHFFKYDINTKEYLKCHIRSINNNKPAQLTLSKRSLILTSNGISKEIFVRDIYYILYRTKNNIFSGLEIFTNKKESIWLEFDGNKFRTILPRIRIMPSVNIKNLQLQNFETFFQEQSFTNDWINMKITNFEYLMMLNIFSGRSFNDISQYPIFPWILTDYESDEIDFDNANVFRDFSKPICQFDSGKIDHNEFDNSNEICNYLIRLEPFFTYFSNKTNTFNPENNFNSISKTYEFALKNPSCYQELIPEFFFQPEFLRNLNQLQISNLGLLNDVQLPNWANGSTTKFIYLHRKALESNHVSKHLNKWIDLIWGINRKNKSFIQLFKTDFHPKRILKSTESNILFDAHKKIHLSLDSTFILAKMSYTKGFKPKFSFHLLDKSGFLQTYSFDLSFFLKIDDIKSSNHLKNKPIFIDSSMISPSFYENDKICFVEKNQTNLKIFNFDKGNFVKTLQFQLDIVSITNEMDGWLAVSSKDAVISLYYNYDKILPSISSFRDSIKCMCISTKFDSLVCGTRDNWLLFCRLSRPSINLMKEIDGRPQKILITESMGFVVVYLTKINHGKLYHYLNLYTINGDLIKSKESALVSVITSAKNTSGFDYLILADSNNNIFIFEAFYLDFKAPFYSCDSKVISLYYINDLSFIVVICENGTMHFIFQSINK
ncbi:hypothetical protein TRFO_16026 [Tritrichomonas foetus]|uniref:BEACH domain-containing protein n=1 Tax=Tritrichomonas foetus TaxID=1144522 RepID=A0A1J4KVS4_9EUKA|nr:hypothetical protein TRFO_16026 [Tritrichomonas foetus]|eukprot:OHT13798.1 hypothetical protein TRFO_16026 [Tritrichomonas foetus]